MDESAQRIGRNAVKPCMAMLQLLAAGTPTVLYAGFACSQTAAHPPTHPPLTCWSA
jgi:hypothetical protein